MNRRLLAIIIAGVLVLAAIIYFVFIYDFNGATTPTNQTSQQTDAEPVISTSAPETTIQASTRTEAEKSRDAANQLAIYFAERYGSSSSQADFSNLVDAKLFMTDGFKVKTDAYIAAERAKAAPEQAYAGITTKAIIADFKTMSEITGVAEVTVRTKRQETDSRGQSMSYNQDLNLTLRKVNGEWKVDNAAWASKQ